MKKKYGLFKVLAVLLLLVVVLTYFIKGRDGSIVYLGLADLFFNYMESFYYFFDTVLFILFVGGFYGFINKIPAYKNLVNKIVEKIGDNKKRFVVIVTIVFALIASLTGLNVMLLLFMPFVISIILLIGYDKLVAISSTIGASIVGFIGGVFVTVKGNSSYSVSYQTFDKLVGLDSNWDNIIPKVILLVVLTGLLIFYITSHIKKCENGSVKYKLSTSDNLYYEVKEKAVKSKGKKKKKVIGFVPFIVMSVITFIITVLGFMPWNDLFGVDCFEKFHTWLTKLKIGKYAVFNNLISSNITAFGTWGNLGNFMMLMFVILLVICILALIYRIKFDEVMDSFLYGAKKMIPAAIIVALAYAILVCSYNNGFIETIIKNASDEFGDNVLIHALISVGGSILNVDAYYVSSGIFSNIVSNLSDSTNLSIYAIMFQSIFGLVQIVGPTSIMLIVGLSYLEVPYKEWLRYIWRFVLEMIIAIVIVLMITSLL